MYQKILMCDTCHLKDPPPEEANIVEKILLVRTRPAKSEEELQKYGDQVEEFLVKYKN